MWRLSLLWPLSARPHGCRCICHNVPWCQSQHKHRRAGIVEHCQQLQQQRQQQDQHRTSLGASLIAAPLGAAVRHVGRVTHQQGSAAVPEGGVAQEELPPRLPEQPGRHSGGRRRHGRPHPRPLPQPRYERHLQRQLPPRDHCQPVTAPATRLSRRPSEQGIASHRIDGHRFYKQPNLIAQVLAAPSAVSECHSIGLR